MAVVSLTDIPDLVSTTLRHLGPNRFQQIAQPLQTFQVVSRWLKRDKVQFDSGIGIQRTLMNSLSRQARHVGVTHTVRVDIPTLLTLLRIEWVHAHVPWGFAYHEILTNSGEAMILNVLKPRRVDALLSLATELESKAWSVPAVGNTTEPLGIPYWIVYNASTGFNGGAPSGYTTVGGVNLTTTPNFKNYTAQYTTVSKADLIKKMRTGHRKCRWIAPISNQDYRKEEYADFRLYTDSTTMAEFEDIGEGQNENLGRDLAPFGGASDVRYTDGTLLFRKAPLIVVDQLDDTAVYTANVNPVYMIDHSTFYPVCLQGDFMRESKPIQLQDQPNLFRVDVWLTYNYLCVDRRRNALFAKS